MLKFLVLIIALLLPVTAQAETTCDTDTAIPINIRPVFDDPRYNLNASIADIQRMMADTKHSIAETMTLGVTHYEPMVEFRTPVRIVIYPNGDTCTRVQNADVTIGYKDVTVYVAREIPQNSCGFKEVMAHERKHINVNWQMLQEYMPRMRKNLDDYLTTYGAFRGEKNDGKLEEMQADLQQHLNQWSQEMLDENIERQKLIDSPEEYKRLSEVCDGQLGRLAGQMLHKH